MFRGGAICTIPGVRPRDFINILWNILLRKPCMLNLTTERRSNMKRTFELLKSIKRYHIYIFNLHRDKICRCIVNILINDILHIYVCEVKEPLRYLYAQMVTTGRFVGAK